MPLRVLICGSRHYTDSDTIRRALAKELTDLDPMLEEDITVMHGDCSGADRLAADVLKDSIYTVEAHPADWQAHGKAAGPIRNRQMLDMKPVLVIAFGTGRGTRDTVNEAHRRLIPVVEYE